MKTYLYIFFLLCLNTTVFAGVIDGMGSYVANGGGYALQTNDANGFASSATAEKIQSQFNITLHSSAIQGAAIWGEFDVVSGQTFSFDWDWSASFVGDARFNDFAFVSLKLNDNKILDEFFVDTFTPVTPVGTTETYSWIATSTGTLEFGIGIMGASTIFNFEAANSALNVSNIKAEVPLPGAIWLFTLGLVGLFGIKKRA